MGLEQKLRGFGNFFQSEAKEGALPLDQNSPQKTPFNLYPEQINGSAFTCPRSHNFYTWFYRLKPSVVHSSYELYKQEPLFIVDQPPSPEQFRFDPFAQDVNHTLEFQDGLVPVVNNGCARIYLYQLNTTSSNSFFVSQDGEFLFVPQKNTLSIHTELGSISISPGEIAVIPRGIKFQVLGDECYGYLCESLDGRFELPNLGPIGANGLANPHDFVHPNADFYDKQGDYRLISLYQNHLWQCHLPYHPLNVVAWKGNYLPYKYDLSKFNTINTVSFDHPDPSIFTVLTVPSLSVGTANIDFVIFPERWMVAEHTFRPPYFHKNIMSEFMGLIYGQYDAKRDGFKPGGFSIHNCMSAHGPDATTYEAATNQELKNERYENTLAFMLESRLPWNLTDKLKESPFKQNNYLDCWHKL